jgi:hypothetical protein
MSTYSQGVHEMADSVGSAAEKGATGVHPTRAMMLVPTYTRWCTRLGIRPEAGARLETESAETQAPHAQLRRSLQADPGNAERAPRATVCTHVVVVLCVRPWWCRVCLSMRVRVDVYRLSAMQQWPPCCPQ